MTWLHILKELGVRLVVLALISTTLCLNVCVLLHCHLLSKKLLVLLDLSETSNKVYLIKVGQFQNMYVPDAELAPALPVAVLGYVALVAAVAGDAEAN